MAGRYGKLKYVYSPAMCSEDTGHRNGPIRCAEDSGHYVVQGRTAYASSCGGGASGGHHQGGLADRTGSQARL